MSSNGHSSDSDPIAALPRHRANDRVWKEDWNPYEKLVAQYIISRFGTKDHSWPGQKLIARDCGVCERTVRNCLKTLVNGDAECGLLPLFTKKRRKGGGNEYRFVHDPESLLRGRAVYDQDVHTFEKAIRERLSDRDLRHLGAGDEEIAQIGDLKRRSAKLGIATARQELGPDDYDRQVRELETEERKVARKAASRRRKRPAPDADEPSGDE